MTPSRPDPFACVRDSLEGAVMPHLREMFRPLCLVAVVFVSLLAFSASQAATERLSRDIVPVFQRIDLTVDADRAEYDGSVYVELLAHTKIESFRFHAQGLTITELTLRQAGNRVEAGHEATDGVHVTVTPAEPLRPGDYTLEIDFTNTFDTQAVSLYRMDVEGQGYTFTQMEEDDAREAFPCWDEPSFKFPYQMILTVPEGHLAISNTPIETEEKRNGWTRVTFERSPPMPSYLLAIATGPFDTVAIPGLGVPARVVTVKGNGSLAAEAVRTTPPILAALAAYFDSPYPYAKLDLIAAPEFWPGAMENPGAIIYSEALLLPDPKEITVSQRRRLVSTTAHELAHMWFGDLVTMAWWDDLWLNEAFATWMGDKIGGQVYPELGFDIAGVQAMQGVLSGDARPSAKPVRQPVDEISDLLSNIGVVYQKGRAVLNMYEQWVGEEVFRQGVLDYINANAWSNATADDLFESLSAASGRDMRTAMATFIEQPGAPLLSVTPNPDGSVTLEQTRLSNYGVEPLPFQPWHIPVTLAYPAGGELKHITVELSETSATVDLGTDGPPHWILPHAEARGYYRWVLPADMMVTLADNAADVLSARERVGYLGNLSALLEAGAVGGDDYLRVLYGFRDDPDPQVISSVVSALGEVEGAFVTDAMEDDFSLYLRATLKPALDRYGLTAKPEEDETIAMVRPRLIGWLADEGHDADAKAYAEEIFNTYMDDPAAITDPSLIGVSVSLACMDGDQALFDECKQRFETTQIPTERNRFLGALGSFRDSLLQEEALRYALEGPLRPQEFMSIPGGIARTSDAHADRILQWLFANYETILGRIPPVYKAYMPYFASGCSTQRLHAAQVFFAKPEHQSSGTDITLARLSDSVNDCVSLREREGARVADFLSQHAAGID
jgi:alanyl aminopeptidase